jgi:hypothetical protein
MPFEARLELIGALAASLVGPTGALVRSPHASQDDAAFRCGIC